MKPIDLPRLFNLTPRSPPHTRSALKSANAFFIILIIAIPASAQEGLPAITLGLRKDWGAVCPGCGLPFSRHSLSPNLLAGKLERCPHCRKLSILPRAPEPELQQAEARLAEQFQEGILRPEDQEARRRQSIVDSRFEE